MRASIVMSTYNGEAYIEEQLDSICIQLTDEDELIICDDCSTDDTVQILKQYFKVHDGISNIQIIRNEVNLGFQNNFKKAMELSTGDFVFFADQDDIWVDNKIDIMIDFMNQTPDCKLLCCDYEPFRSSTNAPIPPKGVLKRMPNDGTVEKVELSPTSIYLKCLGCCMCLRRDLLELMKDYWFDKWPHDDRCWRIALCVGGLYKMHRNLVLHRIHDNNTSTFGKYHDIDKRVAHFEGMIKASEMMRNALESMKAEKKKYKIIENNARCLASRIAWMRDKRISFVFRSIRYISYYEYKKSIIVEFAMVFKTL